MRVRKEGELKVGVEVLENSKSSTKGMSSVYFQKEKSGLPGPPILDGKCYGGTNEQSVRQRRDLKITIHSVLPSDLLSMFVFPIICPIGEF